MVAEHAEEEEELRLRVFGCFQAGVGDVQEARVPEDRVGCGLVDEWVVEYELTELADRSPEDVARFAFVRAESA